MSRKGFVIHHNGPPANVVGRDHARCEAFWAAVKRYHTQTKRWSDIAYSFGACHHDHIFTGRGWDKVQWANGSDRVGADDGRDSQWYTVLAFVGGGAYGGFDTGSPEEPVSPHLIAAIERLIAQGRDTGRCGSAVLPHNQFKPKACPGPTLTAVAARLNGRPIGQHNPPTPTPEDDDNMRLLHPHQTPGDKSGIWLLIGDNVSRIATPTELKALQKLSKVTLEPIDDPGWQCIRRTAKADTGGTVNVDAGVSKAIVDEFYRRLAQ